MVTQEKLRKPVYPESPFPGVPAWRMDIAPVGTRPPELTPEARQFLVRLTQMTNRHFDETAVKMNPGGKNEYFNIRATESEAHILIQKTAKAVYEVVRDNPRAQLVFFPAGAIPLAESIRNMGFPTRRMHVLDISGSVGTESGSASIKNTIPAELLDPDNDIVIPEDIIDSVDTIFKFIQARGNARDNSAKHIKELQDLGEQLRTAHENGNNDPAAYAKFAEVAAQEHVSVLSIWSKNNQARKALMHEACCVTPSANPIQQKLFNLYPIT